MQEVFNLFVGYPACHSERSEESRIICLRQQKAILRCFASLNMTSHEPELTLQPARLPLQ
jgi:hypothetical protein